MKSPLKDGNYWARQEIPSLYGTSKLISTYTKVNHCTLFCDSPTQSTTSCSISLKFTIIYPISGFSSFRLFLCLSFCGQNRIWIYHPPCAQYYKPHPSHPCRPDLAKNIREPLVTMARHGTARPQVEDRGTVSRYGEYLRICWINSLGQTTEVCPSS